MVGLVRKIEELHKHEINANTDHDRKTLQREISAVDWQIDRLVYQLYELTEQEIVIVEEAMAK